MKEFLGSPKKTAILGLVGSLIMMIIMFMRTETYLILLNINNLYIIGLVIYFIIILMRMLKQNGNVKIANYILVMTYIVSFLGTILTNLFVAGVTINAIELLIDIIVFVVVILYFCNILLKKINFLDNKVFAIIIIITSIYRIINICNYILNYAEIEVNIILEFIKNLAYIMIVPYFYNYYKLLKGGK